jgi:hypothetical protein
VRPARLAGDDQPGRDTGFRVTRDGRPAGPNTSGVPWSTLYYKHNYPRRQRVKARWDPRDVFHHALSIELPS